MHPPNPTHPHPPPAVLSQVILRRLALELMRRLDDELRHSTAEDAALYEHRLQVGGGAGRGGLCGGRVRRLLLAWCEDAAHYEHRLQACAVEAGRGVSGWQAVLRAVLLHCLLHALPLLPVPP